MNNPSYYYQLAVQRGDISDDPQQRQVLLSMDRLFKQLCQHKNQSWWRKWLPQRRQPLRGLYLWGGVGIGKTFLMDLFFNALPDQRKRRMHFHRFMQQVHHDLKRLQGQENPLQIVARHFSLHADILCLDEFFVNDITDAMLLANLLDALFERGVVLLTTSNIPPDDLYKNGLQRALFLPAIAHLQQHCEVIHVQTETDYRLRTLTSTGVFFTPHDAHAEKQLTRCFELYAHGDEEIDTTIDIETRPIRVRRVSEKIVWFSFDDICSVPRSQHDYLAIAKRYPVVIVSGIPQIPPTDITAVTYLINLVDVFYDEHTQLILSSAVPLDSIYRNGSKSFEFQRTLSRLREMQSPDWFDRPVQ